MNKTLQNILACALFCLLTSTAFSQYTLYNMRALPQKSELNPAFQPDDAFYLYLPGLSLLSLEAYNSGFTLDELNGESTINGIFNKLLDDKNQLGLGFNLPLLGFGFSVGDRVYVNYATTLRTSLGTTYPKDLLGFATGNYDFKAKKGRTISFSDLELDAFGYVENSIGGSYKIDKHLTVGANFKILAGIGRLNFKLDGTELATAEDLSKISLKGGATLGVYGTDQVEIEGAKGDPNNDPKKKNGDFSRFNVKQKEGASLTDGLGNSLGFAMDLGGVYEDFFYEGLMISASLTDIGLISWSAGRQAQFKSNYDFTGADINKLTSGDGKAFDINEFQDNIEIIENSLSGESTWLSPKLHLGGSYRQWDMVEFNALSRTVFGSNRFHTGLQLAATFDPGYMFGLTGSITTTNEAPFNAGLGFDLRLGGFQLYFVADNLLAVNDSRYASVRTGINISIGDHYGNRNRNIKEEQDWINEVYDDEGDKVTEFIKAKYPDFKLEVEEESDEDDRIEITDVEVRINKQEAEEEKENGSLINKQESEVDEAEKQELDDSATKYKNEVFDKEE